MIAVTQITLENADKSAPPWDPAPVLWFLTARTITFLLAGPAFGLAIGWVGYLLSNGDIGVAGFAGVICGIVPASLGIMGVLGNYATYTFQVPLCDLQAKDMRAGYRERISVSGIVDVIEVLDLEDFGPGFIVDSGDPELLCIILGDGRLDDAGVLPCSAGLEVVRTPASHVLQSIEARGAPIPVTRCISVSELASDCFPSEISDCVLIPRSEFPWNALTTI